MAENLSLGKKGKYGEIDFSKIRSGIKKKDLIEGVDSKLKSVFEQIINKIDTNPDDNMLSREELQAFWQELENLSKNDGNLSKKEARKYQLNGESIGRKGKDALFAVLNKLTEVSKDVKNIKTETIDGQEVEVIEYNNNKIEKVFPDGSKIVIITNGKSVKSTTYDKNDNKKEECVEDDNTKDTTIYDGEKKIKVVVLNKNDQTKTTVYYDNSEIPIKRELEKGNVKEEFEKVDVNGKKEWQKSKKIERINDFDQTTSYKYDAQGSLSSENVVTSKGTIERSYNADGSVTSIISNKNEPVHTLNYQKDNESDYTDSYQAGGANITDSYQDNKHIRQVKEINGTSYEVNYDENGNTVGIIVQNGESIQQIANRFGVSVKDLIKVNAAKIHGKYPNAYFSVGDEIKIPRKVNADEEALQGRKSREEAISEYREEAEIRRQKAEGARAAKEMELQSREKIKWTEKKYNTFYEVAEQLFKNEGTPNPTKEQIQERAEELKKDNPKLEDGDLKGKVIYAMVSKETFERVTERAERKEIARNQQKSKEAEALAKDFYQIADKYESGDSIYRMQKFINENINKNNILDFITAYNKGNIKQGDNSIIDTITSEKLTPGGQKYQKALLKNLMNILCEAAKDAGVPKANIEKARKEFDESVDKEYKAFYRLTNPIDMEAAMNYLCGEILAAKNKLPSNDSDNAIEEFKKNFETTHKKARRSFDTAREEEGVFAKAGDWVCGIFGCNTIEDLENKLKIDKENLEKLLGAKTEDEFKVAYKKIFGIDFDKNKILAYQNSVEQYNEAVVCNELIKQYDKILKMRNWLSLDDLKKELGVSEDTISEIVGNESNEENIKNILLKYIQISKEQLANKYQKITKGKSLEQLQYEMDMLNQSAYGTNDIAKEVAQFNKNMIVTEMVTLGTAEIAGTILLQFVPGAGQLAAARLAAKTVSWGAKFAKVTKALNTIEKGFAVAKKFQTGQYFASNMANRAGQIGFNMATTGTATAVAGKINENDAKEILHKTLMNMSFAGVGSTSSILAPKLMKAFNISNTLATELAEEIINAAGSYGVVTYTGGEYGQQDAFIDMVTGLIIARLSHIKSNPTAPAQGRGVKTPAPEMPAPKAPAPELDNTRPQAREQSTTPVIDKASSHGEANPSVVNIGAKKADAIKTEVESALNNPEISGEELARIRQEVEALSDRELRRELLEKIDNKAKSLEAPKQEVFNEKKAENLENNVNHIFEKHSELNATDVRVLNEYISGIEDVNVLNELKDKLRQKELTHGGVTANYKNLYKSIDDRVKALTPKPEISNEKVRSYVYSMLNSDKGMVKEEVEQLLDYIKNVSSQEELKEIASLVGKKKMIGTYKKQLQNAINERSNTLKTVNNEPKVEETPEVEEAPRSDNTPKNDGIQDDINASGNYKKDVNGHILPEEYKNMSNDELIEEYTRLKEYELDGTVRQVRELSYELDGTIRLVRELSINSHDASAQKSAIRQELENRGLKLTRSYDGNKTVYGYDNAEKAPDSNKTHESENANKTPGSDKPNGEKSFETMNPDELFTEYYRLKMEVTYSPLSTADKAANINKMKEIEKLINQKGYKIEGDKIIKNNNEAPKSESSADKSEAPKSKYTAAELRQKLGEKLYKAYQKADDFIAKLRNIDDYKKVKNYIQANFHKYVDIMDHLLDKLEAAAKKIGLKIKKTVLGETTSKYFRSKDVADFVNAQYVDPHTLYQDLLNKGFEQTRATYFSKDQAFISMYDPKGKTLYTYIYEGTECVHKSKCYATRNADGSLTRHSDLTVDYKKDGKAKVNIKEGNADIYTETVNVKNPSQHIDPKKAEAISKFDPNAPIVDLPMSGDMLNLNAQYALDIDNLPELTLINGTKVDLDSPEFRNKIASLKDGEFLTIGREGDIKLYVSYNSGVSRHHILITRQNGQIVMKDISKFGKTLCSTKIAQGYAYGFDISSGRISANDYTYRNIDDLKNQMRDVLDRFSTNSQNVIINDLMQKNSCRLQKHGIEYQFSMRGNTVHLEEFDITTKYNITESIIDNYSKQTTYDINDINDIFWAINGKLNKFSPETQSYIINKLSEGDVCRLRKGGISYEFTLDANGRITIKEYDYARYNYDNSQRSEDFNNNRNNRANNAGNNEAERMSKIEKQERIQTLESLIERADDISKFKTKFANLFSSDFKVSTEADVQELKKTTRLIKAFWHTDAGSVAPTELQMTIDELFNMTDGKYVSNGAARMGTPAEVNSMLEKLRQLTDINALEKELAELKG